MVRQEKGQSVVEFALIIPLFLLLILGMIYGGFAYADYLQYSTAVREAARDIAMQKPENRQALVDGLESDTENIVKKYASPLTTLYKPDFSASITAGNADEPGMVQVSVKLKRNVDVRILPEEFQPLQCTMPLEKDLESSS